MKYGISNYLDTLDRNKLIIVPSLPNQVEDAVRSIEHARQYLREGIFWRHFFQIRYYLLFLALLLFFSPLLTLRYIFQIVIVLLLVLYALLFLKILYTSENLKVLIFLPIIGLSFLFWMVLRKTKHRHFKIYINMVFLGLAWTLFGAVILSRRNDPASPDDFLFYGVQLIGLLAACLVPYVQALPKKQ